MDLVEEAPASKLVAHYGSVIEAPPLPDPSAVRAIALTRLGWLHHYSDDGLLLLQLRGCSLVEATEGRFELGSGDWIVFDPESRQQVRATREGLAVGLLVPQRIITALPGQGGLLPGRGRAPLREIQLGLRLWRTYQEAPEDSHHLHTLLRHLGRQQEALYPLAARCPGRTATRRWQVLARMQRVRMMLQGNLHRPVRLAELAKLSRFSEWWVSKTHHAIYGETVQEASQRMRMERACALLEYTDLSISEIGGICGFYDPCSFARLFKQRHGKTASVWREAKFARRQIWSSQQPNFSDVLPPISI